MILPCPAYASVQPGALISVFRGRCVVCASGPADPFHLRSLKTSLSLFPLHDVEKALGHAFGYRRWLVCREDAGRLVPVDPRTGHDVDEYDDHQARLFPPDAVLAADALGLDVVAYVTDLGDEMAEPLAPWFDLRPAIGSLTPVLVPFSIV
jgi:hypothetical protein